MSLDIQVMGGPAFGLFSNRANFDEEFEIRRWFFRWSFSQCRVGTEGMGSDIRHMLLINQLSTKKACKIIHHDLENAQRLPDEEAINAISNWLEDMQPFNEQTHKEIPVSFST